MQFLEGKFKLDCETTIGVEFGSKIVDVDDKKIKMQIWDTVTLHLSRPDKRSSSQLHAHITADQLEPF